MDLFKQLANEIKVGIHQISAAVELLDGGATVPFIARYRKEVTGGLDDIQLRELEARLSYLRELEARRTVIIKTIEAQGKLTPELHALLLNAPSKQELEDLYTPYKVKRRTKGQMAREAGLERLADLLFAQPNLDAASEALPYVQATKPEDGADFTSVALVLDGVRDILSERWAEDARLVQLMREWLWQSGELQSKLVAGKNEADPEVAKFRDYFDYSEPISRVPSHRALAVFRGRGLEFLDVKVLIPTDPEDAKAPTFSALAEGRIAAHLRWTNQNRASDALIKKTIVWTWRVKLSLSTERDLLTRLREDAEKVATKVFADNLRDLLLAAPAGPKAVMGLDPGIRTGVKVAIVDSTGKLLDTATIYPHEPRREWEGSLFTLAKLAQHHRVELIAIGNGTASRETDKLAGELIAKFKQNNVFMQKIVVSEAGASVYSASEYASQEMPDIDVSLRGAVSIARRLQDPLAELVKIDPKSIGVGQYQHDLNQGDLAKALDAVVEDCVNGVGVDLNMASVPLLSRVSGLSGSQAKQIVAWRDSNGAFTNRQQLLKVPSLGAKAFEQCAGFLRIRDGDNPLDRTSVHPESYDKMQALLAASKITFEKLLGDARDPRPDFKVAKLTDGVNDITDLREGMILEGTVSNVAQFGAFIDLGVHQDGLVHVSQMAARFVSDAREVVKTGDIVSVKVMEIDVARKRIGLSMRLDASSIKLGTDPNLLLRKNSGSVPNLMRSQAVQAPNAMMAAFAKLKK
ncbi:MAG: Tex family protein [Cytophagales bacterium]|nr:Tex family protein [Cytophagales bacterium]